LFLTAKDHVEDRVKGLELGADDYLVKPFSFSELLARVRTILRRGQEQPCGSDHAHGGRSGAGPAAPPGHAGGKRIDLTAKEFGLLELLMRRHGEVLPRSLIASQVWDMNFDSDTNVIDVAIRRLRLKVDDGQSVKLIQTVRGMGYVLEGMLSRLLLSRLSLTRRLSLFFTLVAASVVLGLGGLFMTAADRHFIELDRSVLQDKRHLIDDILASANSAEDLRWRLSEALNHHHGLFARVTTPTGQTLFQTEGFPEPDRWLLPEHETLPSCLDEGAARTAAIPHPAVPCPGAVRARGPTGDHPGHGYDSPSAFSG
jgi:hypothetical protein